LAVARSLPKIVTARQINQAALARASVAQARGADFVGRGHRGVLTKPYACPGTCVYCPTEKAVPKSYLSNEPAVMRAIANQYNPYSQVQSRLKMLHLNGHATDKIELIVMGGTWSYFSRQYKYWFIKECFRAANEFGSKKQAAVGSRQSVANGQRIKDLRQELLKEQHKNERVKNRIIGLTLETRPDYVNQTEIKMLRELGCTRVELEYRILKKRFCVLIGGDTVCQKL
jgi:elongator complex protein 3